MSFASSVSSRVRRQHSDCSSVIDLLDSLTQPLKSVSVQVYPRT